jgi:hypothetical protein
MILSLVPAKRQNVTKNTAHVMQLVESVQDNVHVINAQTATKYTTSQ